MKISNFRHLCINYANTSVHALFVRTEEVPLYMMSSSKRFSTCSPRMDGANIIYTNRIFQLFSELQLPRSQVLSPPSLRKDG